MFLTFGRSPIASLTRSFYSYRSHLLDASLCTCRSFSSTSSETRPSTKQKQKIKIKSKIYIEPRKSTLIDAIESRRGKHFPSVLVFEGELDDDDDEVGARTSVTGSDKNFDVDVDVDDNDRVDLGKSNVNGDDGVRARDDTTDANDDKDDDDDDDDVDADVDDEVEIDDNKNNSAIERVKSGSSDNSDNDVDVIDDVDDTAAAPTTYMNKKLLKFRRMNKRALNTDYTDTVDDADTVLTPFIDNDKEKGGDAVAVAGEAVELDAQQVKNKDVSLKSVDEYDEDEYEDMITMIGRKRGGEPLTKFDFQLRESDLTEQFIRGSGAGGQKVNKTASCVSLVHVPTNTRVKCMISRSQAVNRRLARKIMKERVSEIMLGSDSKKEREREKIRRQKARSRRRQKLRLSTSSTEVESETETTAVSSFASLSSLSSTLPPSSLHEMNEIAENKIKNKNKNDNANDLKTITSVSDKNNQKNKNVVNNPGTMSQTSLSVNIAGDHHDPRLLARFMKKVVRHPNAK